jgi:hypothetical protein
MPKYNLRPIRFFKSFDIFISQLDVHRGYIIDHYLVSVAMKDIALEDIPASSSRFFKLVVPTMGAVTLVKLHAVAI